MDLDGINFSYGDKVHESGVHNIIAVSPSPTSGLDGHESSKVYPKIVELFQTHGSDVLFTSQRAPQSR